MSHLVTIATFNTAAHAHMIKGLLESEGIFCALKNEHQCSLHAPYTATMIGIELQVLEQDIEQAVPLLRALSQTEEA